MNVRAVKQTGKINKQRYFVYHPSVWPGACPLLDRAGWLWFRHLV